MSVRLLPSWAMFQSPRPGEQSMWSYPHAVSEDDYVKSPMMIKLLSLTCMLCSANLTLLGQ